MNSELKGLERSLRHRKVELEKLIEQMKSDQLNKSTVYKNLNDELGIIEARLKTGQDIKK